MNKVIKKFEIECEYIGENEKNNYNVAQVNISMKGADDKLLRDISFSTEEEDLGNMTDKQIKEHCWDYIQNDFEMVNSEDDKHEFFMENSDVIFVEGDIDTYGETEVEKAIKSIDVKCIAFAEQEDIEDKEYTLNINVIGYDDSEYWSMTDENFTVIVEDGDDEEERVTDEIIDLIIEQCNLEISDEFIRENINIDIYL